MSGDEKVASAGRILSCVIPNLTDTVRLATAFSSVLRVAGGCSPVIKSAMNGLRVQTGESGHSLPRI